MKTNSLYSIMAIAAILSLSFCKDDKDDPDPIPMPPMEQDPAGITYSQQDDSPLSDTFTLTEEDSNNNMVEYTIVLNTQPTENVEVEITLSSNSPSNLSIASGSQTESGADSSITLTYTTDTWDTPQTVTLTLADDNMSSSINGSLTHIVTSGDPNYNNNTLNKTIELQLRDTEAGVLYQKDNASLPETIELTEGTDSEYSYMIVLTKQPTHDVTININLNNSPDNLRLNEGGTPVTFTSIIFRVDDWNTPQTINLTFTDNEIFFGPFMSTLTHITSSTDDEYMGIPNKDLMISLIDDEILTTCTQPGVVAEDDFTPDISGEDYGDGTENDPYIICNGLQLHSIRDDLDAFYELGKDIDASSITAEYICPAGTTGTCTGFQPIGHCGVDGICGNADDISFIGTLDGKGFIISHLRININVTSFSSYVGLFGSISGANIRNIGLLNVDIDASSSDFSYVGGLVGRTNHSSSITNSYSTGNVSSSISTFNSYAGGLVGQHNNGSISNSYSTVNVSSSAPSAFSASYAGGLTGHNINSSIINSYSTGNVSSSATAASSYAGGLVGRHAGSSSITNSYSTGNVSSSATTGGSYAGGLVGRHAGSSSITNSYSTGNVSSSATTGGSFTGGLVGWNNSSITNSYYDRNTSTLSENGSEVSDTAVDHNNGTLTCVGGFSTSEFMAPTEPFTPPTTEPCEDDPTTPDTTEPLKPFFKWYTPFDIDNADTDNNLMTGIDQSSVRYDINDDGSVADTEPFIWNFGTDQEYPFIASIPGTVDEQAVRMASGFLRFSNTTIGELSEDDFVFFYDINDITGPTVDIVISGTGVQGTTANGYEIQNANRNALDSPEVMENASGMMIISVVDSDPDEFYLSVTFTKGTSPMASYNRRYRFMK